jgi:hypothetical protein
VISSFNRGKSFSGVCPFHFDDICNQHVLILECVTGKVSVLFMISVINLHFSIIEGSGKESALLASLVWFKILSFIRMHIIICC